MPDARDAVDALREAGELRALAEALLVRGEDALERGAWDDALADLDEARLVAARLGDDGLRERARAATALARRADGRAVTG